MIQWLQRIWEALTQNNTAPDITEYGQQIQSGITGVLPIEAEILMATLIGISIVLFIANRRS